MANELEIIIKGTDKASEVLRGVAKESSGLGNVLGGIVKTGALAAAAGIAVLGVGVAKSIQVATAAEKEQAQLAAVLKSTHGAAGMTAESVNALADSLSKVTPFEDEAVLGAENMLLTFTSIGKEIFPRATETVLDMSQALGQDLKSSAIQLGKALNDPISGVTALQRVGVKFTEQQKEQIKTLVESGHTLEAQKLILQELQTEFGGSAKAAGQTFGGQLTILQTAVGNLMEEVGGAFLPMLKDLTGWVNQNVMPAFREWAKDAAPKITQALKDLGTWIKTEGLPTLMQLGQWIKENVLPRFQELVAWVQTNWPVIQQTLSDAWATIQPVLQAIGDLLRSLFQSGQQGVGAFAQAWPQIQQAIANVWATIQPILQTIFDTLSKFWAEVQPKLEKAWSAIQIKIQEVWTFIHDNVIVPTANAIAAFMDKWGAQLQALWTDLWNIVGGVIGVAWSFISGIIKIALDLLGGDFDAAGRDWKEMMDGIWTNIKQIFSGAWDAIKNIVVIAATELWNAIDGKMREIATNIQNIWNNVTTFFANLPSTLLEYGKNIIQGLIDGFWKKADDLRNALMRILGDAIQALKDRLLMHSPSQVFAEMGAQMAAGLMQGFAQPQLNFAPVVLGAAQSGAASVAAGATDVRGNTTNLGGVTIVFQLANAPRTQDEGNTAASLIVNGLRAQGVPV